MNRKYAELIKKLKENSPAIPPEQFLNYTTGKEKISNLSYNQKCILKDFQNKSRENLTHQDAIAMIMDGPLITDAAFCYYLPRLAEVVLLEGAVVGDFLQMRLETLDFQNLRRELKDLVAILIGYIEEIESYLLSEDEQDEIK